MLGIEAGESSAPGLVTACARTAIDGTSLGAGQAPVGGRPRLLLGIRGAAGFRQTRLVHSDPAMGWIAARTINTNKSEWG
ncbi:MAG: hypothetical protein QG597_277 [Actinomycetota bacterium]|nr:hypothetical protein [Actinomycetota bacterium]